MINYVLQCSLVDKKIVTIMYMKDSNITQRRIKVLKIQDDLIKAIDVEKDQIRTFKKDNILSAMVFPWEGHRSKKYEKV